MVVSIHDGSVTRAARNSTLPEFFSRRSRSGPLLRLGRMVDTPAMLRCFAFLFATSSLLLGCGGDSSKPDPAAKPSVAADPHPQAPQASAPDPDAQAPEAAPVGPPRDVTPSGQTREVVVDGLKMSVPIEWVQAPGASAMRKAEFTLPGPGGDVALVVYRFAGGAGSAEQNIERWQGQMTLAAGAQAQTLELEANGLKLSGVDLRGRFAGQSMPGAPPQPPVDDARLLAIAIEGSGDPYYFKLVGSAKTIDVWAAAWTELLATLSA